MIWHSKQQKKETIICDRIEVELESVIPAIFYFLQQSKIEFKYNDDQLI